MIYYFFICFYYAQSQIAVTLDENYSHKQSYLQKSTNFTFAFNIDKGFPYYLIEIRIVSQMQGEVALLYQEKSAPSKDQNGELSYDWMDYNGYILNKAYQYIIIYTFEANVRQKQYVTVLSTKNINYVLQIQGLQEEPCPNDCNSNGKCYDGYCYCNDGWIDEDCSQRAVKVNIGNSISILTKEKIRTYAYYQHNGQGKQLELTISTNTLDDILVQILVPNLVYLPTNKFFDASAIINRDKSYHAIILQTNTEDDEVPEDLIIVIQQQEQNDISGNVQIQIKEYKKEFDPTLTIVFSVIGSIIVLCLILMGYICRRYKKMPDRPKIQKGQNNNIIDGIEILENDKILIIIPQDPTTYNEQECTICLDQLNNGKEIRRTPCKQIFIENSHVFHTICIKQWVECKHSHCPNCRENLNIEQQKQHQVETRQIFIQPNNTT